MADSGKCKGEKWNKAWEPGSPRGWGRSVVKDGGLELRPEESEEVEHSNVRILPEEHARWGNSQGKGAEVDISLASSRRPEGVREREGSGAVVRTLAFPPREMGGLHGSEQCNNWIWLDLTWVFQGSLW